MIKYIAILRGINVGGHRKILMADLRLLFADMGFIDVKTYIQSGNVAFKTELSDEAAITKKIESGIFKQYGFEVPVLIRTKVEIDAIIDQQPFLQANDANLKQLYLTFLDQPPKAEAVEVLRSVDFGGDTFQIIGREVFIEYQEQLRFSKLSNNLIENRLNCTATSRNWKTLRKIQELLH